MFQNIAFFSFFILWTLFFIFSKGSISLNMTIYVWRISIVRDTKAFRFRIAYFCRRLCNFLRIKTAAIRLNSRWIEWEQRYKIRQHGNILWSGARNARDHDLRIIVRKRALSTIGVWIVRSYYIEKIRTREMMHVCQQQELSEKFLPREIFS